MTRDETKVLLNAISKCYPNYKVVDPAGTVDMWHFMLQDYTMDELKEAFRRYELSNTTGFAPAPGQLVNMLHVSEDMNDELALQAWDLVYKAICNSLNNSKEEFEKLPELCQKAVGSPANLKEWAGMNIDTVNSVSQGQFIKAYSAALNRQKLERRFNRPSMNNNRIGDGPAQVLLN